MSNVLTKTNVFYNKDFSMAQPISMARSWLSPKHLFYNIKFLSQNCDNISVYRNIKLKLRISVEKREKMPCENTSEERIIHVASWIFACENETTDFFSPRISCHLKLKWKWNILVLVCMYLWFK